MGFLSYTDADHVDIGVLQAASLDLECGGEDEDSNTFMLTLDRRGLVRIEPFAYVYVEGTEYGGMVTKYDTNTDPAIEALMYKGMTWHGMINAKVIRADPGTDHLVVTGEANSIIASILHRLDLDELFVASTKSSGIQITNYQFDRHAYGYDGLRKMLDSVGAKLKLEYDGAHVVVWAEEIVDHSLSEAMDPSKIALQMSKDYLPVNHLVCLGTGEMEERIEIDLYADKSGNISRTQSLFGIMENAKKYDYSSAGYDELLEEGTKTLEEYQLCDTTDTNLNDDTDYDIGDIVGSFDPDTGALLKTAIHTKIVTIDSHGEISVEYKNAGKASDTY